MEKQEETSEIGSEKDDDNEARSEPENRSEKIASRRRSILLLAIASSVAILGAAALVARRLFPRSDVELLNRATSGSLYGGHAPPSRETPETGTSGLGLYFDSRH